MPRGLLGGPAGLGAAALAPGRLAAGGVGGDPRPDDQEARLAALGSRAVLRPARDDEQLARADADVTGAQLHDELAVRDDEDLVLVVVRVPFRRSGALGDAEHAAVGLADDVLRPILAERFRLGVQRDSG